MPKGNRPKKGDPEPVYADPLHPTRDERMDYAVWMGENEEMLAAKGVECYFDDDDDDDDNPSPDV